MIRPPLPRPRDIILCKMQAYQLCMQTGPRIVVYALRRCPGCATWYCVKCRHISCTCKSIRILYALRRCPGGGARNTAACNAASRCKQAARACSARRPARGGWCDVMQCA